MKMRELLEKVGLAKRDADSPPTELDRNVAALRVSVESITKASLGTEDRALALDETLEQFRDAVLGTDTAALLKALPEVEDEQDEPAEKRATISEEEDPMNAEQVQKMQDELTAVTKRLSDAEEKVAKYEAAEVERQMVAKAEALVAGTGLQAAAILPILKAGADAEQAVAALLKSHREAVANAQIFAELGSAAGVTVGNEVESIADTLRKADPKLTKEQAIAKAYQQNPGLYDAAIRR